MFGANVMLVSSVNTIQLQVPGPESSLVLLCRISNFEGLWLGLVWKVLPEQQGAESGQDSRPEACLVRVLASELR